METNSMASRFDSRFVEYQQHSPAYIPFLKWPKPRPLRASFFAFILCLETLAYLCLNGERSPAFRREHEEKPSRCNCGQRITACRNRICPGKENQAFGPSARCRKNSGSAKCRSHHSPIFRRERKGPNLV